MDRCPDGQMSRRPDGLMFKCPEVQIGQMSWWSDRCLDGQMSRWSDVWMVRCTDGQKTRWSDVQMVRCLDGQMSKWPVVQIPRYLDVFMFIKQILKYWYSLGNPSYPSNDPPVCLLSRTFRKSSERQPKMPTKSKLNLLTYSTTAGRMAIEVGRSF